MEQKPLEARLQLTESERERLYAAARASRMSTNRYLTHITRQALDASRSTPPSLEGGHRTRKARSATADHVACGVEWITRGTRAGEAA